MKNALKLAALAFVSTTALMGCATAPAIPREAGANRTFVIEEDLVGATVARGEFKTITGVKRAFSAQLNGTWDGETLTLVEDFAFDDGEKDRKTWRLKRVAPGRYEGTREDVVGVARGFQDGAVFRLEYDVILPSKSGKGTKVRFRDVMAETATGDVLNNANVSKWGFKVGQVSLVIKR